MTTLSGAGRLRAVFDTNVVVSALVFGRRLAWLRQAWRDGSVVPVVCRPTVDELLRVLAYPKFKLSAAERQAGLEDYLPFAQVVQLPDPLPALPVACRDRNDVVFLQLTLAAADLLVSGDGDLAALRDVLRPTQVIAPGELKALLDQRGGQGPH